MAGANHRAHRPGGPHRLAVRQHPPGAPTTRPARLRPRGRKAAREATEENSLRIAVPGLGTLCLPLPDHLAYLAGIAVLTAFEVVEWPVGVALAAGHLLAANGHSKIIQDF